MTATWKQDNYSTERKTAGNSTYKKLAVQRSADSFVVKETTALGMNGSAENPAHRKSANRCATLNQKNRNMRQYLILIFIFLTFVSLCSQSSHSNYFEGKRTYCTKPSDSKSIELFDLGVKCIHNNLYLGSAAEIFQKLIKTDSTFCDAYFWAGYTFRLSNMNKEAVTFYYMADSLAQNKSIEFKQNLATTSMLIGAIDLSRKKFIEMTKYFPESPEGYYGIALTSTMIGDVSFGLENIEIAENIYKSQNKDTQFLKAILLTLNNKYQESLEFFENTKSKFSKDDNFNSHYALSLLEVGKLNNDEKMLKLARKHYNKVKNKDDLVEEIKQKFE